MLTAVHDPVPAQLRACLRSVWSATTGVEHIVVDDASTDPRIREVLARVRPTALVTRRATNGGICTATADALALATGEWVVLLDHDDVLTSGALDHLATFIAEHPQAAAVYTDHDLLRPDGRLAGPSFKPDFSPERLRHDNYITHLVAVRRDVVEALGGIRAGTDGAQDHDLLLRITAAGLAVEHFPHVMYHWRQSPDSVATDAGAKPYAYEAGVRVVAEHLASLGIDAAVEQGTLPGTYRIHRHLGDHPLVSVVIPTRGTRRRVWGRTRTLAVEAIRSITARSGWPHLEFVVVADPATPTDILEQIRRTDERVVVVHGQGAFNFSARVNQGVAASGGPLVLLLNDDTELHEPTSLHEMAALLSDPPSTADAYGRVGAVGARLLFEDGRLQHGGHVYIGAPTHACLGWRGDTPGPSRMLAVTRECSGVTAAALMTTREVFDEVGGFPTELPLHFNDVAFSLAVRDTGRRILYTPHATWYHFEGSSRTRSPNAQELAWITERWSEALRHDPYHNPNLMPGRDDWLERPGLSGAPPYYIADRRRRFA